MCSAECTLCPNTEYYALADITLLRFDVRAFTHTHTYCARYGYPGDRECRDRDVELFRSTPRVPWRQQPARPRIKVL